MEYNFKSGDEFLTALKNQTITKDSTVSFKGCPSSDAIKAVEAALQSGLCPKGLQIDLSAKDIDAEGAKEIAKALQSGLCPQALQINLAHNKIGDAGAKVISNALQFKKCPSGLKINLAGNNIRDAGAKEIANILRSGRCPQSLQINLDRNQISDAGMVDMVDALQSEKCPPTLQITLWFTDSHPVGTRYLINAILSGKCPEGLQITGNNHKIKTYLGNELKVLLPPSPEMPPEEKASPADENEWSDRFNAIRGIFYYQPEIILENTALAKMTQDVLEYYMRSLQDEIHNQAISETDYKTSYYPAFLDVANVILAMTEFSQPVSDKQKQWLSGLLLTLAGSIIPPSRENLSDQTYLWLLAQKLVLTEKALFLYSESPTAFARHWQHFSDEINKIPKEERTTALNSNKSDIAVNYYNQIKRQGLTEQPGVMVSATVQTNFFASQNKVKKSSDEDRLVHNNNLGPRTIK